MNERLYYDIISEYIKRVAIKLPELTKTCFSILPIHIIELMMLLTPSCIAPPVTEPVSLKRYCIDWVNHSLTSQGVGNLRSSEYYLILETALSFDD